MNLAYSSDEEFIRRLTEMVEAYLENENLGVDELVRKSGLSPGIVRQRIKTILQKPLVKISSRSGCTVHWN